jgi:hypothetical protein
MSQVNVELGLSATATISLNDAAVRNLAGVPSGAIGMNNLQGKSNVFQLTISSNQIDANLRTLAINAGWNGTIPVQATINSGVWISGSVQANSTAALTINGSFPNGVTLINNGTIAGRGGNGGNGYFPTVSIAGTAGGLALLASVGVTIQNNGTIAGGGGGGGGGGAAQSYASCSMGEDNSTGSAGGGGGGGGRSNVSFNASGGTGSFGNPTSCFSNVPGGTGGTGTSGGAGAGGAGGISSSCTCFASNVVAAAGGSGGGWGSAGGAGATAASNPVGSGAAGGGAGFAVSGNGNISWTAFGTRLGPIG